MPARSSDFGKQRRVTAHITESKTIRVGDRGIAVIVRSPEDIDRVVWLAGAPTDEAKLVILEWMGRRQHRWTLRLIELAGIDVVECDRDDVRALAQSDTNHLPAAITALFVPIAAGMWTLGMRRGLYRIQRH